MGIYYNPPQNLPQIGRKLNARSHKELLAELQEGEHLFGLFDRGVFYNAPMLDEEREYVAFMNQVILGNVQMIGFFAVKDQDLI